MKDSTKTKLITSWRIIVAIGMVSITSIALLVGYIYYKKEIQSHDRHWTEESKYSDKYLLEHNHTTVRLKDAKTGKYLTPELEYIYDIDLKDSITVFRQDNKRGFLNIKSGQIIIPAQYDKAWVFSEGVAAVVKDEKVGFVNQMGEIVIPLQYKYLRGDQNNVDFLFRDGYATVISENEKHGLIDKNGKWVLEPQYDYINNPHNTIRIVKLNNKYGVIDKEFKQLLAIEYDWLSLRKDGVMVMKNNIQQLLSYDFKTVLKPFVFDGTNNLHYSVNKVDADGYDIKILSDYAVYQLADKEGLYERATGKIITKATYHNIEAVTNMIFECQLSDEGTESVFINSKEEELNNIY
ncbi:MAG: WG repeat-containing protein [Oscillospiraceae bacterium]